MIRTLLALLPAGSTRLVIIHSVMTLLGVALRGVGVVLLVPIVGALFGHDPASAWPYVGALAAVTLLGWIVDGNVSRRGFDLGFGLLETGQRTVADRIAHIRLSWFTAENTATARQAVAATGPDLVGIVIYLVVPVVGALLLPLVIALALVPLAWPLAVAALAGIPLLMGAWWLSSRLNRDADAAAHAANLTLTERVVEFARTQQALRSSRRVNAEHSLAGAALDTQHRASTAVLVRQVPSHIIFALVSQVALLVLAGTAVALATRGTVTIPEAIALLVVAVRYMESFTTLAELSPGIETTTATLRRIRAVLEAPVEPEGSAVLDATGVPAVTLDAVTFRYGVPGALSEATVLDNLTLEFAPGSTTAIVGPSGSGKSTILALLSGLQHPTSGSVRFDGVDASSLEASTRRSLTSVVFQEPYLVDATVRDNVQAGDPSADAASLAQAARLARVDPLVDALPDGWDTTVGEGGRNLSGGERQRVSIARALVKPAPLLLVDEATSALDTENEAAVVAALRDDPRPRTRIIVAHRLASIRSADRVIFLEEGRVVEDGSPEELLAAQGRFAQFWQHQEAASGWRLRTENSAAGA